MFSKCTTKLSNYNHTKWSRVNRYGTLRKKIVTQRANTLSFENTKPTRLKIHNFVKNIINIIHNLLKI